MLDHRRGAHARRPGRRPRADARLRRLGPRGARPRHATSSTATSPARVFEAELAGPARPLRPARGPRSSSPRRDGAPVGCVALRDLGRRHLRDEADVRGRRRARHRASAASWWTAWSRRRGPPATPGCASTPATTRRAAQRLYESAGFRPIPPYYDPPEELRDWLRYYERAALTRRSGSARDPGIARGVARRVAVSSIDVEGADARPPAAPATKGA